MGGKKKGLSFEDKRQTILRIFHSKKEVFNLKEVESFASKAGVVFNTVKEVLQSLVDDDLVDTDKIGSGNYFWSFPSKQRQELLNKHQKLEDEVRELKTVRKALRQQIENELTDKPESEERVRRLEQLKELNDKERELGNEIQVSRQCSRAFYDECIEENKQVVQRGNVWTDNIWNMKSWLLNKNPGLTGKDVHRHFAIPEELDDFTC